MAPKKKAVKKAPSVGLRGKKKRVPPAAGLRPKKEKPLVLELGKKYENKAGDLRGPLAETPSLHWYAKTHPLRCPNTGETFRLDGMYATCPSDLDLVREVVKRRGK